MQYKRAKTLAVWQAEFAPSRAALLTGTGQASALVVDLIAAPDYELAGSEPARSLAAWVFATKFLNFARRIVTAGHDATRHGARAPRA